MCITGRGTKVTFKPDHEIFGKKIRFKPEQLLNMARSKAYLFGGVRNPLVLCTRAAGAQPGSAAKRATFHFPEGLKDYLAATPWQDEPRHAGNLCWAHRKSPQATALWNGAVCWFGGDGFFQFLL